MNEKIGEPAPLGGALRTVAKTWYSVPITHTMAGSLLHGITEAAVQRMGPKSRDRLGD